MDNFGKELILDLHNCDVSTFTRESIKKYLKKLCKLIDMTRCELHFWDYKDDPEGYKEAEDHLKGTSAIQFITTSNITVRLERGDITLHSLDELANVYINIFSCKNFDGITAREFSETWFHGQIVNAKVIERI